MYRHKIVVFCLLIWVAGLRMAAAQSSGAIDRAHANIRSSLEFGNTCTSTVMNNAISSIAATEVILLLSRTLINLTPCTWALTANVTFPRNITVWIPHGVKISLGGFTLTFDGPVWTDDPVFTQGTGTLIYNYSAWGSEQSFSTAQRGFIVSGCLHGVAGGTSASIATCRARTDDGVLVNQASVSVNYTGGNGTYWLDVHRDTTSTVSGWTRVSGTALIWKLSATEPTPAAGTTRVMKVTVAGAAISAVEDIRRRIITTPETVSNTIPVGSRGEWTIKYCQSPLTVNGTWTFQGKVIAEPDCAIFGGAASLNVAGSGTPTWYPEWFGALGDGTTVDTTPFTRLFASLPAHVWLHPARSYVVTGLTIGHRIVLEGQGTLKIAPGAVATVPMLLLTATADDSRFDFTCDGNLQPNSCMQNAGADHMRLRITGFRLRAATDCTSQSIIRLEGGDGAEITMTGYGLERDASCPFASSPRGVSVGGGATNTRVEMHHSNSAGPGIVVGTSQETMVVDPVMYNLDDNGVYGVDGCKGLHISGGNLRKIQEAIVLKCDGASVTGTRISNVLSTALAVQDSVNILIDGVTYLDDADQTDPIHNVIRVRSGNVLSTNIVIRNSFFNTQKGDNPVIQLSNGIVNGLQLLNNTFEVHWTASSLKKRILDYDCVGDVDSYTIVGNKWVLVNDTGSSLAAEIFFIKLPNSPDDVADPLDCPTGQHLVDWPSYVHQNIMDSSRAQNAEFRIVGWQDPKVSVRHGEMTTNIGPYLTNEATEQFGIVFARDDRDAAPSLTASQGSFVTDRDYTAAGGTCTTWRRLGWACTGASPCSTWTAVYTCGGF